MAKFVVTATTVTMGGDDISTACARAELVINAAEVETTDFGSGGFTEVIGGLKSGTLSLDFHQDFGTDAVSTLFLDTVGTVVVFHTNSRQRNNSQHHDASLHGVSVDYKLYTSVGRSRRPRNLLSIVSDHRCNHLRYIIRKGN